MTHNLPRLAPACIAASLLIASPALAQQDRQIGIMVNDAQNGAKGQVDITGSVHPQEDTSTSERTPKHSKPDLLIVPIPQSSPALGPGLTVAGVLFYNPNHSPSPWITGIGGMYKKNKSWGAAAFHSMSLAKDRFRVLAFAGYVNANVNFYGIGPNAGARGVSVDLNDKGKMALLQAQYRVMQHIYVGGRFEYLNVDTTITRDAPLFPDLNLPQPELKSSISAIGPVVTYDSRDNQMNPRKGIFVTVVGMFNLPGLGSDFEYQKLTVAADAYLPITKTGTLAISKTLCAVSKGGPFYDLCMYGQSNSLRGYEMGRYRDRASWTLQAEWRQHLGGRFGAVFFAGVGGIAPDLSSLDQTKFLPSAGMGLRYQASKAANVNLHLDFAIGDNSSAIYFGIAEAF
jgi:outer membrane protein assembly factor BamA